MAHTANGFIFHNKKLLLLHRDSNPKIPAPNTWGLIGGGVEPGETPLEAMFRECKEETNIEPKEFIQYGQTENRTRFYSKLTDDEASQLKLGDEGQAVAFIPLSDLPNLPLTPRLRKWVDNHFEDIKYLAETDKPDPAKLVNLIL